MSEAKTSPRLSVVVPAYNEERTLETIVKRVLALPLSLEVLVVNDGSKDKTAEIVAELARSDARVRGFHLARNSGKGAAVRRGISEACGDYVVIQDGDLEYDPHDFEPMLAEMERSGLLCLYGSRRLRDRSAHAQASYYWGGVVITWFTNLLYRSKLTDEPTCYKMWKADIVKKVSLKENRFGFEPEVTAKVSRIAGVRIYEVGISYYGRTYAEGKKINWKDGFRAIYCIIKYNTWAR